MLFQVLYKSGHVIVEKVCDYFGVKIAMYFAYLGHYTAALLWPAFLGTMFWLLSGSHQVNICFIFSYILDQAIEITFTHPRCFFSVIFSCLALGFASLGISFHLQPLVLELSSG